MPPAVDPVWADTWVRSSIRAMKEPNGKIEEIIVLCQLDGLVTVFRRSQTAGKGTIQIQNTYLSSCSCQMRHALIYTVP